MLKPIVFEIDPTLQIYCTLEEWLQACQKKYGIEFASLCSTLCAELLPEDIGLNSLMAHAPEGINITIMNQAGDMLGMKVAA